MKKIFALILTILLTSVAGPLIKTVLFERTVSPTIHPSGTIVERLVSMLPSSGNSTSLYVSKYTSM